MNILYLAHRIPYPPNKGDKIRAFRQIDRLRRRHKLWCAYFVDDPADERWIGPFGAYCYETAAIQLSRRSALVRGAVSLLRGRTLTEGFYAHSKMNQLLDRWSAANRFDAVVAFSSSMVPYALRVPTQRHVLDLCDCDSQKWRQYADHSRKPLRWLYKAEASRLEQFEAETIPKFDATIVISESEARIARRIAPCGRLQVVTNGVQVPDSRDSETGSSSVRPIARPVVGFLGVMNYKPNVDGVGWFVRDCWPEIRTAHPDAEFRIVGRNPARAVRRLSSAPGVRVIGAVKDIWPELAGWRVSVAPLRIARGLQNKVLEAMAAARPVVLTTAAADGIDAKNGREFLVADTPNEIADRVKQLLSDADECLRLGQNARHFVRKNHRWDDVLDHFEFIVTGAGVQRSEPRTAVESSASSPEKHIGSQAGRAESITAS
ncbi:MAG: TIGR03087 family PEP-CTERM/XrtA system glycosyltransferase [Planctomycetes bacterium]|nr:TIGR03087 family PEP-CTERM/XrtA system glycosyltransferase [Planctomycetota bacterium]MBI3835471.1 TIGR03087 family PEP-CTERM/XrtA system glycosyltransferase [Planctomycetota bacterium]